MRHSLHPNSERAGVHDNPSEVFKASSDIWLNVSLVLLIQPGCRPAYQDSNLQKTIRRTADQLW
jgi:hypothetical protein